MDSIMEQDKFTGFSQMIRSKEGELAGFVLAEPIYGHHIEIKRIAVMKDYKERGLGQQLLQSLAANAIKAEMDNISLRVLKKNQKATAFYERHGFQNVTPQEYQNDPQYTTVDYMVTIDDLIDSFDSAMATSRTKDTKGGIDLNPELLTFKTQFSSSPFKMPALSREALDNLSIYGYSPVIINITPMSDPSIYVK